MSTCLRPAGPVDACKRGDDSRRPAEVCWHASPIVDEHDRPGAVVVRETEELRESSVPAPSP